MRDLHCVIKLVRLKICLWTHGCLLCLCWKWSGMDRCWSQTCASSALKSVRFRFRTVVALIFRKATPLNPLPEQACAPTVAWAQVGSHALVLRSTPCPTVLAKPAAFVRPPTTAWASYILTCASNCQQSSRYVEQRPAPSLKHRILSCLYNGLAKSFTSSFAIYCKMHKISTMMY